MKLSVNMQENTQWKLTTQAKCPSKTESKVPRRQPVMSMTLSTCNRLQQNCKPKCRRDVPKESVYREVRAPETQRVMFPGAGISRLWGSGFIPVRAQVKPFPRATWEIGTSVFLGKKKKSCPWEMKPGSADVISSIDFSRSNTSQNSRQCHGGPSNLQIGLIKGLLLCQLDTINDFCTITETNHLLDTFMK